MEKKQVKMAALSIELALVEHDCNIVSTYDESSVIVLSGDHSEVLKSTGIYQKYGSELEDEEVIQERIAHKKEFDICIIKIAMILEERSVRIDTTYDYSNVMVFDKFGNTKII